MFQRMRLFNLANARALRDLVPAGHSSLAMADTNLYVASFAQVFEIIAMMCEAVLVGAFAMLITLVIWLLVTRHRTMPTMHKVLCWASVTMFLISVAHLAIDVYIVCIGKVPIGCRRARVMLAAFQFIIGDLILIWRVWVVWNCSYLVASGPLVILIVAAAFTFNLAWSEAMAVSTKVPIALVIANTSLCTLLIAGRIWFARYQLRLVTGALYSGGWFPWTVALFIESGALYVACQIASIIFSELENSGTRIVLDLEIPLIGILPTLIIVLVQFKLVGTDSSSYATSSVQFQSNNRIHLETATSSSTNMNSERALEPKLRSYPSSDLTFSRNTLVFHK